MKSEMILPGDLNRNRAKIEKEHTRFYKKLKKRPPRGIDEEVANLDEEVFRNIDCTQCANCCKTISPVFKERDIARLAMHLGIKPASLVQQYLYIDEEGDYVLKTVPCPFLVNNLCSVYEARPFACRSYPHTATLPLRKSWDLVTKNSAVCPAVYEITRALIRKYDV